MGKLERKLRRNLMKVAYKPLIGRTARRLAAFNVPPLYGTLFLAAWNKQGFISPQASLTHSDFSAGERCFIGRNVIVYRDHRGNGVTLGDAVHLHENITIQTGDGGSLIIGDETHIQPRCQFSAYCAEIKIGKRVEIAPSCAFYPYNHAMEAGTSIREQPLYARTGITVEDDAWLSYGVVLLDGAHIGEGAVIGANSIVNSEIPANAIAVGSPAKVVGSRTTAAQTAETNN